MLRLSRYLKKYIWMLLIAVVFLCGQAVLDLNLPDRMSDIVNVGIQKSGIEEIAPKAISGQSFALMQIFFSEEGLEAVQEGYTFYSELPSAEQEEIDREFPDAWAQNALILTATQEQLEAVDRAFAQAGYALMDMLQMLSQQAGDTAAVQTDTAGAALSPEMLAQLPSLLQIAPQEMFGEVIEAAAQTPDTMTEAVAAVFNVAFYQELGADISSMQVAYIVRTGIAMALLSLAMVACAVGAGYFFAKLGAGVARDLRGDIFAKVSGFSNAEMDKFSTASLITRTGNDITQVQMLYSMAMRMLVFAPIMGVGGIVMALRKSPNMSWIIGVAVGVLILAIGTVMMIVLPRFKKMQSLVDRLNLVARENLSGIMVVRVFANQAFQQNRFEKANKELTQNSIFVGRAMTTLMPIMMLIMNGVSLFIIWFGAEQIAQSALQVGDMMAFIQYSIQVIMAFLFIAIVFVMVPRASVSAERIDEVLRTKNSIEDPENPKTFAGNAKGNLEFHDVCFRYGEAEEDALQNISFTAKPGQTTAFIGATGSGKSTLINLIPRFYDVSSGKVTLDGVDVRELTQHELRENIGYVPQKGLLFSGDIAYNLKFGNENAQEDELREVAQVAQAIDFIDEMEDGFTTQISQGGTNVSGGQRQRLSMARALAKKAPIYIFDDSFSALDFATDAKLRAALKPYTEEATVLIVAQRVSTIMTAEQIIVLDEGKIVGTGTHKQLLESCQTYKEIAESQLSKEELA